MSEKKKKAFLNSEVFFHIRLFVNTMANFQRKFATLTTYVMPAMPYQKDNCQAL